MGRCNGDKIAKQALLWRDSISLWQLVKCRQIQFSVGVLIDDQSSVSVSVLLPFNHQRVRSLDDLQMMIRWTTTIVVVSSFAAASLAALVVVSVVASVVASLVAFLSVELLLADVAL